MPAHWPGDRWQRELQPWLAGAQVQVVAETGSTNSDLMQALRDGAEVPTLRVALRQHAGRGRMGRSWHAQAGAALTFSLALPLPERDWSGLSLAVGVSLARSLHPQLGLKWPNDLWWQMRKLGGILIETAPGAVQRHAIIGVGINLHEPLGAALSTPAAWLGEFEPQAHGPAVLDRVLLPLVRDLQLFFDQGLAAFLPEFERRDVLRGRPVRLSDGRQGEARGVDGSGALLVHTAQGLQVINSSEVSVRPEHLS